MRYTLRRYFGNKAGEKLRVVGHIEQNPETGEIKVWIRDPSSFVTLNKRIYLTLFSELADVLNKYFNLYQNRVPHQGMTYQRKGVRRKNGASKKP